MRNNPLLSDSSQLGGVPDFPSIRASDYRPAFERAFAEHRAEVRAIRESRDPATFENTIIAMERSGWLLFDVSQTFFAVRAAAADDSIRAVDAWLIPRLSEHYDSITSDTTLFQRVDRVWQQRSNIPKSEDRRIVETLHSAFVRAGARLDDANQRRLQWLNRRLAATAGQFDRNLIEERPDVALPFESEDRLRGLTRTELEAGRAAARRRGQSGHLLELAPTTTQSVLERLEQRESRSRVYEASVSRGARSGRFDRRSLVLETVRLRAERAELLGYSSHADYVIEDETAPSVAGVLSQLRDLTKAALKDVHRTVEELSQAEEQDDGVVAPFDWPYLVHRQRRKIEEEYLDPRHWFELDRVLHHGVFFAATQLYGLDFVERADVVGYHDDVRFFEVVESDGRRLGMFGLDPFAREFKRGGAWTQTIACRSALRDSPTVVISNLNVDRPTAGESVPLRMEEVRTLFHEFGHTLHALFVTTTYPRLAGLNVPRDFVEFPSQVNEMWAQWPAVLANYARHVATGEEPGPELILALSEESDSGRGFELLEQLAATYLDLAWHTLSRHEAASVENVEEFERTALRLAGFSPNEIAPRYTSTIFRHIFAGAYSARYYSYLWSEVLDADAREWFVSGGGLKRDLGERFRLEVLASGGVADPLTAYESFRGHPANVGRLIEKLGLRGS